MISDMKRAGAGATEALMNYTHDRNWGCRISDEHTFRGLRTLIIENELIRVTVLLDKGTDIYEFLYKPLDIDFMWRGPNPLRDPRTFIPASSRENGFFQDFYFGGWQEVFPNGGVALKYKGVELGQHGEVSVIPWQCRIEKDTPEEVAARMWVRTCRTPFYIEKTMRLRSGSAALVIDEKIVNEGREEMEFMWGHHPAFGHPFLDETCRLDVPATRVEVHPFAAGDNSRLAPGASFDSYPIVADRDGGPHDLSLVPPPEAQTQEMCYLLGLKDGWYALTNTRRRAGFGMRWDKNLFPVVWLWEVFGGGWGYPWYGRTYNLALEPWTSWPGGMENAMRKGTTARIGPEQSIETSFTAVAYSGVSRVERIEPDGSVVEK